MEPRVHKDESFEEFLEKRYPSDRITLGRIVFWSSVFAAFMLSLNAFVLANIYPIFERFGPRVMDDPRFRQAFLFVGPVLLLVAQWWILDRIVDWRDARAQSMAGDAK